MQRLILKSFQSPGDIVMLTAAVRDLHRAYPGRFQTDVRTSADALFENNPWITPLSENARDVQTLTMHYPLVHQSNQRPYHFLHGYVQFLEQQLDLRIPVTEFKGDIYLSPEEKQSPLQIEGVDLPDRYWILVAGGKYDFTAKWWNPASYQTVIDHFQGKLQFVRCGEQGHWHPPLQGVTNLIGRTNLREFIGLMYRAEGVVCPVTFAMHLAAVVESPPGRLPLRPCVVIAGGREPTHWEAYPHHQFLSTVGMLSCCAEGGCWKSRCQKVGDGDEKDRHDLCEKPVQIAEQLVIPRCLDMITPADVIRRVEMFLEGDRAVRDLPATSPHVSQQAQRPERRRSKPALPPEFVLRVEGGVEQLLPAAIIRNHVQRYHPQWQLSIDHATHGKEFADLLGLPHAREAKTLTFANTWLLNGAVGTPQASAHWPNMAVADWLLNTPKLSPIDDLFRCEFVVPESAREAIKGRLAALGVSNGPLVLLDSVVPSDALSWREGIAEIEPHAQVGCLDWPRVLGSLPKLHFSSDEGNTVVEFDTLAEVLALIEYSTTLVAYESPSIALASGLRTPTVAVWRNKHPIHAVPASAQIEHLLAPHMNLQPLSPSAARFFESRYRSRTLNDERVGVLEAIRGAIARQSEKRVRGDETEPADVIAIATAVADVPPDSKPVGALHAVRFYHGLGDAANFARLIPLYTTRGCRIGVECTPDKEILFRAAGAEIVPSASATHEWGYPPHDVHPGHGRDHQGSKMGWNISELPLPDIGKKPELWDEYCRSEVRVPPLVPDDEREFVRHWLKELPRPVVLIHTIGNTNQSIKSLPDAVTLQLYRELLDRMDGTIVALDWDHRAPRLATYRFRHLDDMTGGCNTARMFALMDQSDLVIGVDSGPLHAAGLTDTPCVGLWMPGHYPARYSLPHPKQLNLVLMRPTEQWNRYRRVPWNIVDQPGTNWDAGWIADHCSRMLEPPRYLGNEHRAIDAQLQHWLSLCRGDRRNINSSYTDRNRSFDLLLHEISTRMPQPMFVETGTIRSEEDWAGAGFSTYLFGSYLRARGGVLHSVDLSPEHCRFARNWCAVYGGTVQVHQQDSVAFLEGFGRPIDVLYLDSLDTTEPEHAEHALREAQAGLQWLHDRSLILIDDTYWREGAFCGKGAQAVPWLLKHGWEILYAGYQVLLTKRKS